MDLAEIARMEEFRLARANEELCDDRLHIGGGIASRGAPGSWLNSAVAIGLRGPVPRAEFEEMMRLPPTDTITEDDIEIYKRGTLHPRRVTFAARVEGRVVGVGAYEIGAMPTAMACRQRQSSMLTTSRALSTSLPPRRVCPMSSR